MRVVVLIGLLAIANAIKPDTENNDLYTAIFIIVALMDLIEFIMNFEKKK